MNIQTNEWMLSPGYGIYCNGSWPTPNLPVHQDVHEVSTPWNQWFCHLPNCWETNLLPGRSWQFPVGPVAKKRLFLAETSYRAGDFETTFLAFDRVQTLQPEGQAAEQAPGTSLRRHWDDVVSSYITIPKWPCFRRVCSWNDLPRLIIQDQWGTDGFQFCSKWSPFNQPGLALNIQARGLVGDLT